MVRTTTTSLLTFALLAASAVLAPTASGDVPPPPGVRRVPFEIRVEGLAASPDMVLVVYPYSESNGAPTKEHALLHEGEPVTLGRRSPTPKIWAIEKSRYETFAASYKPTHSYEDPGLDAFMRSDLALDCGVAIEPVFELPFADPRAAAVQSFRVDKLNPTTCKLIAADAPHPAPTDTGERAVRVDAPPGAPQEGNAPPKTSGGGCAGCAAVGWSEGEATDRWIAGAMIAACVVGVGVRRRRRS